MVCLAASNPRASPSPNTPLHTLCLSAVPLAFLEIRCCAEVRCCHRVVVEGGSAHAVGICTLGCCGTDQRNRRSHQRDKHRRPLSSYPPMRGCQRGYPAALQQLATGIAPPYYTIHENACHLCAGGCSRSAPSRECARCIRAYKDPPSPAFCAYACVYSRAQEPYRRHAPGLGVVSISLD